MNYIIDSDPGIDDAIALCVLEHYAKDSVKLFVATYGNMPLYRTANNLMTMLRELDWDVPIAVGSRENQDIYEDSSYIHGKDGLGGIGMDFPEKFEKLPRDFEDEIYETAKNNGKVDYLALGPLTNFAAVMRKHPDITEHIDRLIIMGGAFGMGNVTPYAEFNIFCDPESAKFVLENFPRAVLVGLNLTTQLYFDEADVAGNPDLRPLCRHILNESIHSSKIYGEPGAIMHDPTAALAMLFPREFTYEKSGVTVDCAPKGDDSRRGETFLTSGDNVAVAVETDKETVMRLISAAMK